MSDLFRKRMSNLLNTSNDNTTLAKQTISNSNIIELATFTNDPNYKNGILYDWNMNELEKVEFKFQKSKIYSIDKDQVEYMIQFKPGFNPEKKYAAHYHKNDGKERLGFYIDVFDENTQSYEKWIILGKDDKNYFDRYNVLKCNWVFEWIDDDKIYRKVLGCVRDRNNYNSGVWSDGFVTTVQNQTSFITPSNLHTLKIDYNLRFMICDNIENPKTYEITKIMDTFPLGISKFILTQTHYNPHTDFYGTNEDLKYTNSYIDNIPDLPEKFGGKYHMICNCIKSKLPSPPTPPDNITDITWSLSDVGDKIYIKGQPVVIKASPNVNTCDFPEWHIWVDNKEYLIEELTEFFDISINGDTLCIYAKNNIMAKYMIKIAVYDVDKTYYDFVEMEVCI